MQNIFRMWFAIMITTETAWLEGPDTEDLRPVESSYPLAAGRVLRPPVSIEQWDFLITLRVIIPLRKKVLADLQQLVLSNKPQAFTTVFLCTFMLLHLCSMWSADRYRHAVKHDSPVRQCIARQAISNCNRSVLHCQSSSRKCIKAQTSFLRTSITTSATSNC
jgi:predicted lysophospholipase L1 biosynthesis ABC-type transport system permease subunit